MWNVTKLKRALIQEYSSVVNREKVQKEYLSDGQDIKKCERNYNVELCMRVQIE